MTNPNLENKIMNLYETPLTQKDAQEAVNNLIEFFNILIEVDQRNKRGKSA